MDREDTENFVLTIRDGNTGELRDFIRKCELFADSFSRWIYEHIEEEGAETRWDRETSMKETGLSSFHCAVIESDKVLPDYMTQAQIGLKTFIRYRGTGTPLKWPAEAYFRDGRFVLDLDERAEESWAFSGPDPEKLRKHDCEIKGLRIWEEGEEVKVAGIIAHRLSGLKTSVGMKLGREPFAVVSPEDDRARFYSGFDLLEYVRKRDRDQADGECIDKEEFIHDICELSHGIAEKMVEDDAGESIWIIEDIEESDPICSGIRDRWLMTTAVKVFCVALELGLRSRKSRMIVIPPGYSRCFCPICGNTYVVDRGDEIECLLCGYRQEAQKNTAACLEWIGRYLLGGHTVSDFADELEKARRRAVINA